MTPQWSVAMLFVALFSVSAQSSCVPEPPELIEIKVVSCEAQDGISWITGAEISETKETGDTARLAQYVWVNDINPNCRGAKGGESLSVYRYPKCCDVTLATDRRKSRPCDTEPYLISEKP